MRSVGVVHCGQHMTRRTAEMANVVAELEAKTPGSRQIQERSDDVLAQQVVGTVNLPYSIYIK